ncbi:DUF469 family protein [Pseudoduganella sp. FT55W]|uniref:DUF469 family protein n=1 Tax=Duganella rivi TaxID=2666083 RepID=A0A7X4GQX7_9BURK|nr:YggL family protein [Duganella rivi]MYM68040.1 DUF469 family protein [Duganella rivi]
MAIPSKRRRSARLRKKLHLEEFQEFGFSFEATVDAACSGERYDAIVDAFLEQVVEARGLGMGGNLSGAYIQAMDRSSASDADREAVQAWLEAQPELGNVLVHPLSDAWYPPEE